LDGLPPVQVVQEGRRFILWDGFHTTAAHERKGIVDVLAEVRPGTLRDAILLACGANAKHGLPRTNADKRRAVLTLLDDPEWREWSNVAVGRACGVSESLVRTLRPEPRLNEVEQPETRKGRDGKSRKLPERKPTPRIDESERQEEFGDDVPERTIETPDAPFTE